jgi:hypothetical protein
MELRDDGIGLSTDLFARSVELRGGADGEGFGWHFEDNFFDLVPGEHKCVRILCRNNKGTVTAQPFFSKHITEIQIEN